MMTLNCVNALENSSNMTSTSDSELTNAKTGDFSELQNDILNNSKSTFTLTKDYTYNSKSDEKYIME